MMSRMFGAPLGGTTRGGQYGLESVAASFITPPKGRGGGGICFPSMVTVASGEPGVPLICWVQAEGATAMTAAASIPRRRICFADFIGINLSCCCSSTHLNKRSFAVPAVIRLWDFRAIGLKAEIVESL